MVQTALSPSCRSARRATCRPVIVARCGTRLPAVVYGVLKYSSSSPPISGTNSSSGPGSPFQSMPASLIASLWKMPGE